MWCLEIHRHGCVNIIVNVVINCVRRRSKGHGVIVNAGKVSTYSMCGMGTWLHCLQCLEESQQKEAIARAFVLAVSS